MAKGHVTLKMKKKIYLAVEYTIKLATVKQQGIKTQ